MTQVLEAVAFSYNNYYDMLHFQTNSGKLKATQGGLKWMTLTPQRPIKRVRIKLRSKVKRMNPHTFFGVLVTTPKVGTEYQIPIAGDTTAIPHVYVTSHVRFNEWNADFNFKKV